MTMTEKRPRIGVVGSSNVDLVTYVDRMPVWGETIAAPRFEMSHGGKGANQAVAAAKLGATTSSWCRRSATTCWVRACS
jgi:ribokinase